MTTIRREAPQTERGPLRILQQLARSPEGTAPWPELRPGLKEPAVCREALVRAGLIEVTVKATGDGNDRLYVRLTDLGTRFIRRHSQGNGGRRHG